MTIIIDFYSNICNNKIYNKLISLNLIKMKQKITLKILKRKEKNLNK